MLKYASSSKKGVFSLPYIKVDVNKINEYQKNVYDIRAKANRITNCFSSIRYNLDSDVKNSGNINRRLQLIASALTEHSTVLQRMNTFLNNTALRYATVGEAEVKNNQSSGLGAYQMATVSVVGAVVDDYDDRQKAEIVSLAATELGISQAEITKQLNSGNYTYEDIAEYLKGEAKQGNQFIQRMSKVVKKIAGASNVVFEKNKNGYIIVSKFTRNSFFNKLVQKAHGGTGIGTKYTPKGLLKTPVIGTVYAVGKIAEYADKAITVIDGTLDAGGKIAAILNNNSLSKKEKAIDTAAVAITAATGMALKVGAPIAGKAVRGAVTTALAATGIGAAAAPVVGFLAGLVVEKGMNLVGDVVTNEAVVKRVSQTITNVGNAVSSGVAAVSSAAKKVKEAKTVTDKVKNTAKLVGTAVAAGTKVVATAVKESIKTAATVVKEAAKKVVNDTVNTVKTAAKAVVNFFKKW